MPARSVTTYVNIKLNSVEDYWHENLMPNVRDFVGQPSPRTVFNAALATWHLHDWVWHDRNPGQAGSGRHFTVYRNGLLTRCPELKWLRDIADAGKHRGLNRQDIEVAGTKRRRKGNPYFGASHFGADHFAELSGGGMAYYLALNDGTRHEVETVIRTAIDFWLIELREKNLPSPF